MASLGYGSQGHAQAQNLRDSGVEVIIGNVEDHYAERARRDGFEVMPIVEAVKRADIILFLVPDEVQAEVHSEIEPHLREGQVLDFASGYSVHFGVVAPPPFVDVVLCVPTSTGEMARKRYTEGKGTFGHFGVHQDPERLVGVASVDPTAPHSPEVLEHAVTELDFRAVKLSGAYQNFNPAEPRHDALYAKAQELGIPIFWHVSTTFFAISPLRWSKPGLLDQVAQRFPDLRMVICHLGHPWITDAVMVMRKHRNVYGDISGFGLPSLALLPGPGDRGGVRRGPQAPVWLRLPDLYPRGEHWVPARRGGDGKEGRPARDTGKYGRGPAPARLPQDPRDGLIQLRSGPYQLTRPALVRSAGRRSLVT